MSRTGTSRVRLLTPQLDSPLDLTYTPDRLLMPCFSTANVFNMFDDMNDIVSQLILKWER